MILKTKKLNTEILDVSLIGVGPKGLLPLVPENFSHI